MNAIRSITAAAAFLLPAGAMAHPGPHATELREELVHVLTNPDHLSTIAFSVVWAAMIVAVGCWFKPWRAQSWRAQPRR